MAKDEEQGWIASKIIGPKKEWRAYKARVKALPKPYMEALVGVERYVMHFGGISDAEQAQSLFNDVIDIFEQAAADNTPSATSWARTPSSSPRHSCATTRRAAGSPASGTG